MSRGLGKIERATLAVLQEQPMTLKELVKDRASGGFNYSKYESTRRPVHRLEQRGLIVQLSGYPKRYGTLAVREAEADRETLTLMWTTSLGRQEIVRRMGKLPTLSEWLRVGSGILSEGCNT